MEVSVERQLSIDWMLIEGIDQLHVQMPLVEGYVLSLVCGSRNFGRPILAPKKAQVSKGK